MLPTGPEFFVAYFKAGQPVNFLVFLILTLRFQIGSATMINQYDGNTTIWRGLLTEEFIE